MPRFLWQNASGIYTIYTLYKALILEIELRINVYKIDKDVATILC